MEKHINHLVIEQLRKDDYQELLSAMKAAYPGWQGSYWSMQAIEKLIEQFGEG